MKVKNNKASKYVILLKDRNKSSVKKTAQQLNVKLTSSAELSSKVRAQDVLQSGNGLYLKNLGMVIVDEFEAMALDRAGKTRNSPILFWEEEQTFSTQTDTEIKLIQQIKSDLSKLNKKVDQLEELLTIQLDKSIKEKELKFDPQKLTWALSAIGLNSRELTGKGVDICLLDTGLYVKHPDFKDRNITGKSFIKGVPWDLDGNGHGTHCAGIAAGGISHLDGTRYGVASDSNIAIAKVLDDRGNGQTSYIIDALDNCIEKKYKVISLSLGAPVNVGQAPSPLFEHIGQRALKNNCLIIAAAGNNSKRPKLPKPVNSPANAESIMAVGALTKTLKVAYFSNAGINPSDGGKVDLVAPGMRIYSTMSLNSRQKKLYASKNGTSMATPFVAGMAALYWQKYPKASAKDIWLKLEKNAKQLSKLLPRDIGGGLVQAI